MIKKALLLPCLCCLGISQHAHASRKELQSSPLADRTLIPLKAIARFLLTLDQALAFNPSGCFQKGCNKFLQCTLFERRVSPLLLKSGTAWLAEVGDGVHGAEAGSAIFEFLSTLATNREFTKEIWARKPVLYPGITGVADAFTHDHLREAVDSDFLEAGRGIPDDGGWKMAKVSEPRGSSFEDAKMRYIDVVEAMKKGTVVFNSAGAHVPRLGTACLAAMDAFGLPNCINLYVTAKGTVKSAPPHTDKQDVFVFQSAGAKHWSVFEPPPPSHKPHADPLARGKSQDALEMSELSEPLVDCVLKPGDVLYVPAGFPHTTDTVDTSEVGESANADSIHLTIGFDTHIWGLNYASLRLGALDRAQLTDRVNLNTLSPEAYWRLMRVPSSLGFLSNHAPTDNGETTHQAAVASELVACAKLVEPKRWADQSDAELADVLAATEVEAQLGRHADRVFKVQRDMYLDSARDILPPTAPGQPRVSLFRVQAHMQKLEKAMDEHLEWYGPAALQRVTGAAQAATTQAKAADAGNVKSGKNIGSAGKGIGKKAAIGGFGSGGAGGGGKSAKTKKKAKKKR